MKKTRKILIGVLAALAATSLAACFGNSGNQGNGGGSNWNGDQYIDYNVATSTKLQVTLPASERTLTVGDTYLLQPDYQKKSGYSMRYVTSNEKVATVSELGLVTALNEGEATVSAIYSNGKRSAEASMKITCEFGSYLPELRLANINDGVIKLYAKNEFRLNPYVSYNGAKFSDGSFSYNVSDTSVAIVSGAKLTAVENGETTLTISGTWRGKSVSESFPVTVCDNVAFFNDGKPVTDMILYTVSETGDGASYVTTMPNKFSAAINGTTYSASGDVKVTIGNTDVAVQKGATIRAQNYGETQVTLSIDKGDIKASVSFNVTVKRPEVVIAGTVPMFATDYGYYLASDNSRKTLFQYANIDGEIVDAYQGNKTLTFESGKVFGISSSDISGHGSADVVVGTKDILYKFNLDVVAKFFETADDLKNLQINTAGVRGGYYELLNNIDASGISLSHTAAGENGGYFNGIFDGKGYTISNLTIAEGSSMFGHLVSATVRNLALTNLTATKAHYFANEGSNSRIFNDIYVKLSEKTKYPRGAVNYLDNSDSLKNVIIEYTGSGAEASIADYSNAGDKYGALCSGFARSANETQTEAIAPDGKDCSDVYVITSYVLTHDLYGGFVTNNDKPASYCPIYSYGANVSVDIFGNDTSKTIWCQDSENDNKYISVTDIVALLKKENEGNNENKELKTPIFANLDKRYVPCYFNLKFLSIENYSTVSVLKESIASKKDANGKIISVATTLASFSSTYWDISTGIPVWKTL